MIKFFLFYFYIRLPSNVTVFFRHLFELSSCIKSSEQMQLIIFTFTKSTNISFSDYFSSTNIIWSYGYQNHRLFPINNNFLRIRHFIFLLFEDKGRLDVHHNKVKIDHCQDNLYQVSLSEIATDRDRTRLCYNQLGLFNCWIGHNYPIPSNPPHAPRSGAHWPNRMEKFTPAPLETNSCWLFDK